MPVIDGLPIPEALRQVPPRAARPGTEEDPVDHRPVIGPPAALPGIGGQEHPQPLPLLISQVMAFQSLKHRTDLQHQASKIHGTRPSPMTHPTILSRNGGRPAGRTRTSAAITAETEVTLRAHLLRPDRQEDICLA